ncbi:MAG: tetratricopeptide repeat protein [Chitinophagaceae bacterium]|nr:tetratricopeptide repeat protein [Chitinophagaceae bacterium]
MKKVSVSFLVATLLMVGSLKAQSLQDGVNDLYAERYKSAKATFEKLLAGNPNNLDAIYWLGQTYLEMDDVAGAKGVYEKALLASANAPLVLVGMGQVELIQNKPSEARQRFEAALAMTRGKKGDDPAILNAIGRAITSVYNDKEKKGDINYAIEKLEAAAQRDPKNAEIFLNLGNAYRKAKPGEAGGVAFQNYQKAIDANSKFPVPYYRIAMLFSSQRSWDLFQQYLEQAVEKDPKFAPAYYQLYYFKLLRQDYNNAEHYAQKFIENSDPDPANDFLKVQTLWVKKDFDAAIAGAKEIIAKAGNETKAKVYKLLADAYLQKKDTVAARPYIDEYFAKAKPDEVIANDYKLKADIYTGIPGEGNVVMQSYVEGVKADTVLENKIDLLKKGIVFFNRNKQFANEKELQELLLQTKPNLTINDYFGAGLANYRAEQYARSREIFSTLAEKFPDQIYGWEWKLRNSLVIDTVKRDSIAVPDALSLLEFVKGDTVKYGPQISLATYPLAMYYNDKGETDKAVEYLKLMKSATTDPARRESIEKNIQALSAQMQKQKPSAGGAAPKTSGSGK